MAIIYKYDNNNIDFNEVSLILGQAFGGRKMGNTKDIEEAFNKSNHVVYALNDNELIGFARAISDNYNAIIYNVALKPDYQGKGIGKEIIKRLVSLVEGKNIYAYTHPRTISLYEHLGFRRTKLAFKYTFGKDSSLIFAQEHHGFLLPNNYRFENEYNNKIHNKNTPNKIDIKYDNKYLGNILEINNLKESTYKKNFDINITKKDFLNSQFYEFAYDNGKLIGFARLITDGVSNALLEDLVVKEEYQNLGIGLKLVENIAISAAKYDIFIHSNIESLGFFNNNYDHFKRYKTAFYYDISNKLSSDTALPNGYRYIDEYNNEIIKYYKGKIYN